jgi:hypothetical protein
VICWLIDTMHTLGSPQPHINRQCIGDKLLQ